MIAMLGGTFQLRHSTSYVQITFCEERRRTLRTQITHEQQGKPSLSHLTTGNWIIIIAGILFIVSLFLDWASAGGILIFKGIAFMKFAISRATGLPGFSQQLYSNSKPSN